MSRIRNAWRALTGAGPEFVPAPEAFVEVYETNVYKRSHYGFGPYPVLFGTCCEAHKQGYGEVTSVRLLRIDGKLYRADGDLRLHEAKLEDSGE